MCPGRVRGYDKLLTDDRHGLRERVLWRMLYETAARAEELLSLDVEDLDLEFRRGRVTSKGGAIEYVHWATGTARLLPRLLRGRTSGPVFLAGRSPPTQTPQHDAGLADQARITPHHRRSAAGSLDFPRLLLGSPQTVAITEGEHLPGRRRGYSVHIGAESERVRTAGHPDYPGARAASSARAPRGSRPPLAPELRPRVCVLGVPVRLTCVTWRIRLVRR